MRAARVEGPAVVFAFAVACPFVVIPQRSGGICCQLLLSHTHLHPSKAMSPSAIRAARADSHFLESNIPSFRPKRLTHL
jgi:hypothetical protein